jgi:outer membrane protein OmpA-like peptidoglycan-associated protein/tetratricopeptide (TPR) repeat protein
MTMKLRIYIVLGFILLSVASSAQLHKANEAYEHHHYREAIAWFDKAIRKDLDNAEAITKMAICFWKTNQLPEAEYWFTRAALMNDDPEVKLKYAQVLIANKKYMKASEWLTRYMDAITNEEKIHHAHQLKTWAEALERGAFKSEDCKMIPVSINSYALDFAPVLHGYKLYFITNRRGVLHRSGEYDPWTNARFTDVFSADRLDENTFGEPARAEEFPQTPFHDGPLCFHPNGKEVYMTVSDFNERKRRFDDANNTRVKIVRFTKQDETWVRGEELSFVSSNYNTAHPAVSPDGRFLVFASDMKGGQGAMDLYVCERQDGGTWGTPKALGTHINSAGNEVFPYFHIDGSLYFSSNWHPGFGGMDLFRAAPDENGWGLPENLGMPLNSARDDFGICFDESGESGFLSSNRGNANEDEVLFFKYNSGITIEGMVVDCATQEPVVNTRIELRGTNYYRDYAFTDSEGRFQFTVQEQGQFDLLAEKEGYEIDEGCPGVATCSTFGLSEGESVQLQMALAKLPEEGVAQVYLCGRIMHADYGNPLKNCDVHVLSASSEVRSLKTGPSGAFHLPVREGEQYEVVVSRTAFHEFRQELTIAPTADQCHAIDILLEADRSEIPPPLTLDVEVDTGVVIELYHVYFDRNKSTLREDAIEDLDTFYDLLRQYPGMRGELMAHTDSRASAGYNLELSQKRAEAVRDYLIERGIDADRLVARGYGEQQLINHCADGVECTEEQHQRNRRVEFRVIGIDADELKSSEGQRFSEEVRP